MTDSNNLLALAGNGHLPFRWPNLIDPSGVEDDGDETRMGVDQLTDPVLHGAGIGEAQSGVEADHSDAGVLLVLGILAEATVGVSSRLVAEQ